MYKKISLKKITTKFLEESNRDGIGVYFTYHNTMAGARGEYYPVIKVYTEESSVYPNLRSKYALYKDEQLTQPIDVTYTDGDYFISDNEAEFCYANDCLGNVLTVGDILFGRQSRSDFDRIEQGFYIITKIQIGYAKLKMLKTVDGIVNSNKDYSYTTNCKSMIKVVDDEIKKRFVFEKLGKA